MLQMVPLNLADSVAKLKLLIPGYEEMLKTVLIAILDRFERNEDYNFIDTKLNVITGKDFYPLKAGDPPYKSKDIIYSWIQGRGLEALAGHMEWIENSDAFSSAQRQNLITRLKSMTGKVLKQNERNRIANNGHMFFCTTLDGIPLTIANDGSFIRINNPNVQSNLSDLFYSKGLLKAAWKVKRKECFNDGVRYFKNVIVDIINNNFYNDQQTFDPKNKVVSIPGKINQGPLMVSLLGLAEIGKITQSEIWFDYAESIIRRIINFHVNRGQHKDLEMYDFFEAVDKNGKIWINEDGILCDPGHAIEFIGLATKCLLLMRKHVKYEKIIKECKQLFPKILLHIFKLGFNENAGGIYKGYDLRNRKVMNSDMPWWSLPETMRASIELLQLDSQTPFKDDLVTIITKCSNAFITSYINYNVYMMAYQTRNDSGQVIELIPATPDADPGYHTGLCMIDFITILRLF